jgi:hypothetical protein
VRQLRVPHRVDVNHLCTGGVFQRYLAILSEPEVFTLVTITAASNQLDAITRDLALTIE